MCSYKQVDCFRINFIIWKVIGVYPLTTSRPLLYSFYSGIFISFFVILYSILFTINLYFVPKSLENYVEEFIFYFTVLCIMSKVATLLFKKNKIKDIINILESDIFQSESKKAISIINKAKSINKQFWKIYIVVCTICNFIHVLLPLFYHFVLGEELLMPICTYSFVPDNLKQSLLYPLYFYQSIGMHFQMHYAVNIDTFFAGTMIFLTAQLKILDHKLTNVTENFNAEEKKNTLRNEADLILKLNKVLIHHDEVTKFCNLIEDVFSITVFTQFGMGSYIICMCLIRFTMPITWRYFIFLSTYTFAMIVQILIPCWFGTRIMDKSCQLTQAIYSCDWTPRSKRFKSTLRLFVERANRPLSITGWKMFPLSLITFTSIMNTAYSFFTLLRNVQSR